MTESFSTWFCSFKENDFFVEIDSTYLSSNEALEGLESCVPNLEHTLDFVRSLETVRLSNLNREQELLIEMNSFHLYGMIHARYLLTEEGMVRMASKYKRGAFGRCPNVQCNKTHCLPIGLSDSPRQSSVLIFCPRCRDLYIPKERYKELDGAYFGTTFAHLFFLRFPELRPPEPPLKYTPKIFGFRVCDETEVYQKKLDKDEEKI